MPAAVEYDHIQPLAVRRRAARAVDLRRRRPRVILPVPLDRTTSYVPARATARARSCIASAQVELWDEEIGADVHGRGIFTLPEMELPSGDDGRRAWPRSAASPASMLDDGKFLRHARRRALDHVAARRGRGARGTAG